jgi:hypothetical protein
MWGATVMQANERTDREHPRTGGCLCGAIRFTAHGAPLRTGLCHCTECRHETGGPFMAFAIWPSHAVTLTGTTAAYPTTRAYQRHFCPTCGARIFAIDSTEPGEIELRLGAFDAAPTDLSPTYETWIGRREPWLPVIPGLALHEGKRKAE